MKRDIFRTILFTLSMFILFSCSHEKLVSTNSERKIASGKTYSCTGMYEPHMESELSLELTSNPIFIEAKVIEIDQFDGDKKHLMQGQACYGTHLKTNDRNFEKFETFIVPTSDPRNSQGYACDFPSIKISKNAGKDEKWPLVVFTKASQNDGIWFHCQ